MNRDEVERELTLRLRKLALLHTTSDGLVQLGIEDIRGGGQALVVGLDIFFDGSSTERDEAVSGNQGDAPEPSKQSTDWDDC